MGPAGRLILYYAGPGPVSSGEGEVSRARHQNIGPGGVDETSFLVWPRAGPRRHLSGSVALYQ